MGTPRSEADTKPPDSNDLEGIIARIVEHNRVLQIQIDSYLAQGVAPTALIDVVRINNDTLQSIAATCNDSTKSWLDLAQGYRDLAKSIKSSLKPRTASENHPERRN